MNTPRQEKAKTKPYFLLSFIPAAAYWLLETYSTLEVALIGGIVLGIIEMSLEKYFTGHVHTLSKVNVALIVVLGGISLFAQEGIWFKLQPTFTGVGVASFLIFKKLQGHSLMLDMIKDMGQAPPLPDSIYKTMEWHMTLFLLVFAAFMAKVAIYDSTSVWLFWKTGGFYIAFGGFMLAEMIYLKMKIGRKKL
jgi:intracellular septation protein